MLMQQENRLCYQFDAEKLWIEAWGPNALRIRATKEAHMPREDWALQKVESRGEITITEKEGRIRNGKITAVLSAGGKLTVYNQDGKLLLEEYSRNRKDLLDAKCSALEVEARELRPIPEGDYHLTLRLESVDPEERLYGMGQYGTKWSYLTAFAVVTIIPVALIFIFMQKYIISGMTSGAVKG